MRNRWSIGLAVAGILLATSLVATAQTAPTAQNQDTARARPTPTPTETPVDPKSGARIEVTPKEFDFGEAWEGGPAQGEFTIKNVGTEPLTVDAKSSCGCTVPSKPKSPLAPGESTTFTISYSTRRRGPAHKSVYLNTNDPTQPKVTIPVKGNVKALFNTEPSDRVNFPALETDSQESQTVTLTNQQDKPVHLKLSDKPVSEQFKVALKEVDPGKKYELTVTTNPPLKSERTNASIVLTTDLPDVPALTIYAFANVPPRVSLRPTRLYVFPNSQQRRSQQLRLEYRANQPLHIKEMKSDIEGVTFEIDKSTQPNAADADKKLAMDVINVTLPSFDEMKVDQGKLVITTDDPSPEFQTIEVPIIKRHLQDRRVGGTPARVSPAGPQPKPAAAGPSQAGAPQGDRPTAEEVKKQIEEAIRKAQEKKAKKAEGTDGQTK